jgi:C4-dicarboxylate-specific signal transduction histidine kinase
MDTPADGSSLLYRPGPRHRRAVRREGKHRHRPEEGGELQSQPTSNRLWEFAALAHELKQPLAAILSNAQAAWRLLALDPPDLQETRTSLADIIADARRAGEVLRGLQAFVTTGALALTLLNINDIVRETIRLVHCDAAAQGVLITPHLADDLPLVYGDHIQLRQVLLNLVRNAFEAMQQVEDGGRELIVRTSSASLEVVTVEVQDRGIGVDETTMARLFYPFVTTKAGGMGLGLALSRSIIAAHGGWIWATRNPDRGLMISFTLPAV